MAYTIIKTEKQYEEYCNDLHKLVKNEQTRDTDEVALISLLTEKWENDNIPSIELDPISLIKELMNQNSLNAKELGEMLELSKSTISKMLNYNKGLSKDTIRKLSLHFKVSQSAFNKPKKKKK